MTSFEKELNMETFKKFVKIVLIGFGIMIAIAGGGAIC